MPEIKHNFTGGKMNKDLDERLVPKGEYRDAMNVQVSTSEGSDVGTVQNILGNIRGCTGPSFNLNLSDEGYTVGSISDEKNDTLYWLVSGNVNSSPESLISAVAGSAEGISMKDAIYRYSPNIQKGCEPVFIDKYAFSVSNYNSLNGIGLDSNSSELGPLPPGVYSEVGIGWEVQGVFADGSTTNTAIVAGVDVPKTVPAEYAYTTTTSTQTFDWFIDANANPMVQFGTQILLPMVASTSWSGGFPPSLTSGYNFGIVSYVYIRGHYGFSNLGGFNNQVLSGLVGDKIKIYKHNGDAHAGSLNNGLNGYYNITSASVVTMEYNDGNIMSTEELIKVYLDQPIIGAQSGLNTNNYATHSTIYDIIHTGFYSSGAPITGEIQSNYSTNTNIATGWLYIDENEYDVNDLSIGDEVNFLFGGGPTSSNSTILYINDIDNTACGGATYGSYSGPGGAAFSSSSGGCNAILLADGNGAIQQGWQVGGSIYGSPQTTQGYITFPNNFTVTLNTNLDLSDKPDVLLFSGPRTLNFNHGEYITGLDIIDDMLFWTDGKTEPKKINIPRSVEGTDYSGLFATRLINKAQGINYNSNIIVREEHITVIRKSPKNALTLELSDGRNPLLDYTGITSVGVDSVTTSIIGSSNPNVQFDFSALQVGDTVRFSVATDINQVSDVNFAWEVGGYLLLKEFNSIPNAQGGFSYTPDNTPLNNWTIRGLITDHQDNTFNSSTGTVQVQIEVVGLNGIPSDPTDDTLSYVVDYEDTEPVIFEDKFPRFSYRYKYEDGEYSTFAPWSEVAFLPTSFNYDPKKGWNTGMINNVKSIKVKGFKPPVFSSLIGKDIVEVDILYKEDVSPNVYLVQTISPIDIIPIGNMRPWDIGEYLIKSETIKGTIAANQLLRTWDNVPKKALAQAVSGSRIVYGNYEQNYDLKIGNLKYQPDFKNAIYSWTPPNSGTPKKSIKSLRDYKLGVVFTDEYGRETPVLISESGGFRVEKTDSINANKLKVGLKGTIPLDMLYYKFYIKETSSEYYNVPMDRWYKAEDGNIWLAFPSSDRNKIDLDTFLYFKRGAEGDKNVIENSTKYKVLAIENEAPEFIKTRRIRIGNISHFNTGANDQLFDMNNQPPQVNGISFTMSYGAGFASTSLSRMEDITEDIYVQFVSSSDVSQQYKVSEITSNRDDSTSPNTDPTEYYVTLATNITDDINFIFDNSGSTNEILDETKIVFTKAVIENKPQFDGRFFAKIENDGKIQTQITDDSVGTNYVERNSKKIYLLHDDINLKRKSAAAVVSDNQNWVDFDYSGDSTVGDYDTFNTNFNYCVARESYFHKTGNISILQNKPASQVASGLNSRYINNYGDDNENTPSTGQMGVWFIDQGTIKYTIPTTDNDDNDLVWPDTSNMNHMSPQCNNALAPPAGNCTGGYTGASGNVGGGIQDTTTGSTINIGFGGFDFLPRDKWSGGVADNGSSAEQLLASITTYDPDTTFSDYYGTFSDYFSFGNGTRVSNSATFANSLAAGFRFKWKEDPTETIYTITSQTGYRRNARFSRYDHGWPEDGNSSSVEPQLMLMSAASSYTKTFDFEVTPSMSGWNPARAVGLLVNNGLDLGGGGAFPNYNENLYTAKLVNNAAQGVTVMILDDVSSIQVGMSIGFHDNIPNLAKVEAIDTSGFTAPSGEVKFNLATTTGAITAGTDIQFGWAIRLVENNMYASGASPTNTYNHIVVDNIKTECSNGNNLKTLYSLHKGMKLYRYNIDSSPTLANDIVIKDIKEHPEGWEIELAGYIYPLNYLGTHPFATTAPVLEERLHFRQVCMNGASNFTEDNTDACQINSPIGGVGGASNPLGQIAAVGYTMQFVEAVDEYSDSGYLPENPFVWETEPKEDTGLDIYYEISENNPTKLNPSTINLAIPVGSTITSMVGEGRVDGDLGQVVSNVYSSGREVRIDMGIDFQIGGTGGPFVAPPLVSGSILKITKPSGIAFEVEVEEIIPDINNPTKPPILKFKENIHNSNYFLDWHNCYSFGNGVESNRIKDTFNLPFISNGVKASTTLGENYKKEHRKNGLIYSGIYNSTSGINNLNQFIAAEKITKDVNPIYGSIQKLFSRSTADGDLITLCEDRILKILADKDAVFNADGNTQLTATNNVLGQTIPYSGDYGISKNPESFASESYRCYFTDKIRGAVIRLSKDGLTPISDFGMKDWFRDNLKLSSKIIGSYDDRKNEYNVTIERGEYDKPTTVSFKENVKGWVSFKSFIPENAVSCANDYYTFSGGELWKHHVEQFNEQGIEINRNTFYTYPDVSSITAIFNDEPSVIKSFKTLNYEGSQSKIDQLIHPDDGEYYNLIGKNGWSATVETDLEKGAVNEFIEKEGKWFNYIRGIADIPNAHGTFLGDFESSDSSFQGLGRLQHTVIVNDIEGCTDPLANNYDPDAGVDNGTCNYDIAGCTDITMSNHNADATVDDGSCIPYVYGCTDSTAFNHDALATHDNGSCEAVVFGCLDSTASNYDALANTDDGSCIAYADGCTDPNADNHNPDPNVLEDGSCLYSGCTDPNSCDYDSTANVDDGSCTYCNTPGDSDTFFTINFDGWIDGDASNGPIATCSDYCIACEPPVFPSAPPNPTIPQQLNSIQFVFDATLQHQSTTTYTIEYIEQGTATSTSTWNTSNTYQLGPVGSSPEIAGSITNLDPGTTYAIRIKTNCGDGVSSTYTDSQFYSTAYIIEGCTDASACNYDSSANTDDGSCLTVYGCIDSTALNYAGAGNTLGPNGTEQTPVANCPQTDVNGDTVCIYPVDGCMDPDDPNYDDKATSDDNNSCEYYYGCTDPNACNPDPFPVNTDDLSCEYLSCAGCMQEDASNFDPLATLPPPIPTNIAISSQLTGKECHYFGCIDPLASNYSFQDEWACTDETDISTCTTWAPGVGTFMDEYSTNLDVNGDPIPGSGPKAIAYNYNNQAGIAIDDGSCIVPNACPVLTMGMRHITGSGSLDNYTPSMTVSVSGTNYDPMQYLNNSYTNRMGQSINNIVSTTDPTGRPENIRVWRRIYFADTITEAQGKAGGSHAGPWANYGNDHNLAKQFSDTYENQHGPWSYVSSQSNASTATKKFSQQYLNVIKGRWNTGGTAVGVQASPPLWNGFHMRTKVFTELTNSTSTSDCSFQNTPTIYTYYEWVDLGGGNWGVIEVQPPI